MDQKLNYLLDKSIPFDGEKVRLLDNLTQVIQSNSPEVAASLCRQKKLMRFGGFSGKMIIFGITPTKFFNCLPSTIQRSSFLSFLNKP